jgi:hypothetical protein
MFFMYQQNDFCAKQHAVALSPFFGEVKDMAQAIDYQAFTPPENHRN